MPTEVPIFWGRNESAFADAYSKDSRFVVPIISQHYVQSPWCRYELEFAKREGLTRPDGFILPLRLDNTPLLGISDGVIHKDLRSVPLRQIVDDLLLKLGKDGSAMPPVNGQQSSRFQATMRILSPAQMRLLGLIATSPVAATANVLTQMFPDVPWSKEIQRLRRQCLILRNGSTISVPPSIRKIILSDTEETAGYCRKWIAALRPYGHSPDTALYLGLLHLKLKDYSSAGPTHHVFSEVTSPRRTSARKLGFNAAA